MSANREGLSFSEWLYCAGYDGAGQLDSATSSILFKAWRAGEDPTEYRRRDA